MKAKLLVDQGEKTFAVGLHGEEEVIEALKNLAEQENLKASRFTAIGGFSHLTLGFFDRNTKRYKKIPVDQQVEVLSLLGDVTMGDDGKPHVHAHAVVGLADGSTRGAVTCWMPTFGQP